MEDNIVTFRTFDNPTLAHVIKGRLEANDIPCFLADEHTVGMNPLYNVALGGVKLKIFERDYQKCVALLEEDESLASEITLSDDETQGCPKCKSVDVGYGLATKKRFGIIAIVIAFILCVYPFQSRKAWHCYNCGEEF